MLDKRLAADVLTAALSCGGEFAELFVENTEVNNILMTNGAVEKASWGINQGCGIRIFNGLGAIYAYTNDLSRDSLLKTAREAAQAVKNNTRATVLPFVNADFEDRHTARQLADPSMQKNVVALLRTASDSSFAFNAQVTQTSNNFAHSVQRVLIANSDGLWAEDRRVRTRVAISAIASSQNEKQPGYYAPGALKGVEFLETLDMAQIGRDVSETAVTMLNAGLCPSGKMPVVIAGGFGGVIFHEACGHSLEATSVAKNASVFSGRLGEKIASDIVTAIDDGTLQNEWGSINIDDEGNAGRKNVLIENGVLKSYMIDRLNGLKMGMAATGSSRRESYKYAPTSRMTNTFIANGRDKPEDIIADTEYGLYAKKMGGGSVQPATGEFNFAVSEAYIIRNGKIAEPVRGATLIGKGAEVLLNIDRVGNNLSQSQGMCGSVSGSVPTNIGQPTIRVKEIIVGGRR